jgi:hypothetical protein
MSFKLLEGYNNKLMEEWDGAKPPWHNPKDGVDGFTKSVNAKSVVEIHAQKRYSKHIIDTDTIDEKVIQADMAYQLAAEIVKSGHVSFYRYFDQLAYEETIVAEVTVCPRGARFRQVEDEYFKVNDELFTEEEVIRAIKQTYPDRLI